MNDFAICVSLADLVLCVTLVRALVITARWIIRRIVVYIWKILRELQKNDNHE